MPLLTNMHRHSLALNWFWSLFYTHCFSICCPAQVSFPLLHLPSSWPAERPVAAAAATRREAIPLLHDCQGGVKT